MTCVNDGLTASLNLIINCIGSTKYRNHFAILQNVLPFSNFRGREPVGAHETLMIAKHETCIDFYGASEKLI